MKDTRSPSDGTISAFTLDLQGRQQQCKGRLPARENTKRCFSESLPSASLSSTTPPKFIRSIRRSQQWNVRIVLLLLIFATLIIGTCARPVEANDDEELPWTTKSLTESDSSATPTKTSTEKTSTKTSEAATATLSNAPVVNSNLVDTDSISAWDTNLSEVSPQCYAFFGSLKTDASFRQCLPLSVLLENSRSFFTLLKKGLVATTTILDRTCDVDFDTCKTVMANLGREIRSDSTCYTEFKARNPLVVQAYAGFLAYEPLYSASCLKSDNGGYCFAESATSANSTNYPLYFLPLAKDLPEGEDQIPDCSSCTQRTMQIYASFAGNKSNPLFDTYPVAATTINRECGNEWVNTTIEMLTSGSSSLGRAGWSVWGGLVAAFAGAVVLL